MKSLLREIVNSVFAPLTVFSAVLATALLTITGAFGTAPAMSIAERAQYWGVVVVLSIAIVMTVRIVVERNIPTLGYWQSGSLISVVFAAINAPILHSVAHLMTSASRLQITPVWAMALMIFLVSMAVVALRHLILGPTIAVPSNPILFARLSNSKARVVLRVSVRDHYVDVFTDLGVERLLMRFSDAISELGGIEGLQVHRSHWVACSAVDGIERDAGKTFVKLTDGSRIPVSRAYRKMVLARLS